MARQNTGSHPSRRQFLGDAARGAAALVLAPHLAGSLRAAPAAEPIRVAAVITSFYYRSHAHVILENFLEPYLFNGQRTESGMKLASFYLDQFHAQDMSRDVAKKYAIPIFDTVAGALTVGGRKLAVDAVLLIGEHGDYPTNAKGQVEYPRKRLFDEVAAVCEREGRGVPVFNDKHLSYRWDWAREMVDAARRLDMPLMAGSSVPLAERRPPLELPPGARLTEAVSIHGGGVESYDFHGLEVLASMVEARAGGETGVARVRFVEGPTLWQTAREGLWSPRLAYLAMAAEVGPDDELARAVLNEGKTPSGQAIPIHAILIAYRDGLRAAMLKVGDSGIRWNFACQIEGEAEPRATSYYVGPWQNRNLFRALSHAIQAHFRERRAPYPVERTLLTTGMLDAAMDSRVAGGGWVETPQLGFAYAAQDFRPMREMGATWRIITDATPEPPGIEPVGV
jgi:hypothetical protein